MMTLVSFIIFLAPDLNAYEIRSVQLGDKYPHLQLYTCLLETQSEYESAR